MQLVQPVNQPVRTVLHLSPSVTAAAMVEAQRRQQSLRQWMESLVVRAACNAAPEEQAEKRLADLMLVELFAHIASHCPGALTARWRLLFDRCLMEPGLWRYPQATLDEVEAGEDCQPILDAHALLKRWPALVAAVWLVS